MAGAIPTYTPSFGAIASTALRQITAKAPTVVRSTSTSPSILTSIRNTLSSLWSNKGVQIGTGLAATGIGISTLSTQSQEATKPLGALGGITGSMLTIGIVVILFLLLVMRK